MKKIYKGHEFEAIKIRFQNQTELLYRLTMIDLKIFFGFITLQIVLVAWLATNGSDFSGILKVGLFVIDINFALVAIFLFIHQARRRKQVSSVVKNCQEALGYTKKGAYLEDKAIEVYHPIRLLRDYFIGGTTISVVLVLLMLVIV